MPAVRSWEVRIGPDFASRQIRDTIVQRIVQRFLNCGVERLRFGRIETRAQTRGMDARSEKRFINVDIAQSHDA